MTQKYNNLIGVLENCLKLILNNELSCLLSYFNKLIGASLVGLSGIWYKVALYPCRYEIDKYKVYLIYCHGKQSRVMARKEDKEKSNHFKIVY